MKYSRVIKAVCSCPWAIVPSKLEAIAEVIDAALSGSEFGAFERSAAAAVGGGQTADGSIAVIPIMGIISQRMNLMMEFSGGVSTEKLAEEIRAAAANPNIAAIVLNIDSPGGSVFGVQELSAEIFAARSQKPIIAIANSLAASAAYWIASAASEIVVTPSGEVGSIGVIAMHVDFSRANEQAGINPTYIYSGKYKAEGNPDQPLASETLDYLQSMVDSYYADFTSAIAKYRGLPVDAVRKDFGRGRTVRAADAVKLGMADRVGTLRDTVQRIQDKRARSRLIRSELDLLELT